MIEIGRCLTEAHDYDNWIAEGSSHHWESATPRHRRSMRISGGLRRALLRSCLLSRFILVLFLLTINSAGTQAQTDLSCVFADPGTSGNWRDKWFKDGAGAVSYTPDGMVYDGTTGETVLWAKPIVRGDVRVEYDYTHLDQDTDPYVVIMFIQARGVGDRPADISTWQRPVASYQLYHEAMSNYSITYDVNSPNANKQMRARHNPGQTLAGQYRYSNLWERNETYHMTIQKSGRIFSMTARNVRTGTSQTFDFAGDSSKQAITEGRIGLRHMDDRVSRYKNLKIWATAYVGGGGNVARGVTGSGTTGRADESRSIDRDCES